ncbi:MAG TPA: hypothetical protein VJ672_09145 [Gemmatimonadaceae bacterium]|nr:hypothetical protein [Gemmatimonadaceae bacterium]
MIRPLVLLVFAVAAAVGCGGDKPSPEEAAEQTLADAQAKANAQAAAPGANVPPPIDPAAVMQPGTPSNEAMAKMLAEQSMKGISSALGATEWTKRELTMSDVRKFAQAARNLRELQEKDAELSSRMSARGMGNANDIQSVVSAEPKMREAIERAGMTVPDYIGTAGALAQSMMIAQMMKPTSPMRLTEVPPGVLKANIDFVLEHEAEVRAALEGQQ